MRIDLPAKTLPDVKTPSTLQGIGDREVPVVARNAGLAIVKCPQSVSFELQPNLLVALAAHSGILSTSSGRSKADIDSISSHAPRCYRCLCARPGAFEMTSNDLLSSFSYFDPSRVAPPPAAKHASTNLAVHDPVHHAASGP
eukprot:6208887-Pleurochrysis_carterae.AAC.5